MGKWDGAAAVQRQKRLRAGFLRTEEASGIISGQKEEKHEHIMRADGEVRPGEEPLALGRTLNPQAEKWQGQQAPQTACHRGRGGRRGKAAPPQAAPPHFLCAQPFAERSVHLRDPCTQLCRSKNVTFKGQPSISPSALWHSLMFQGLELCTIILLSGSSCCSWSKSSGAFLPAPVHQTRMAPEASSLLLGALSKLLSKQGSKENGQYLRAGAARWERLGMGI